MKKIELNNIIYEFLYSGLIILSNFIIRRLIVQIIGIELVGLTNVLNQLINFLSLFELGVSYIIMSYLYKPLKNNDEEKITKVMYIFKKIYIKISVVILIIGICFIPFLRYFINDYSLSINYYVIYLLLLLQSSVTYYLSYKTFLIRADQKAYLYLKLMVVLKVISLIIEIILFMLFKNYYLYFITNIINNLLIHYIVFKYVDKYYPYLNNKYEIKKEDSIDINNSIKNTAVCKVCSSINGTLATLILGYFSNVKNLGLYSNYYVLINSIDMIVYKLFYAIQSKIGYSLVDNNEKNSYNLLYKMNLLSYILGIIVAVSFYLMVNLVITFWLGEQYLLSRPIVLAFSIQLFINVFRIGLWQYTTIRNWFDITKMSDVVGLFINLFLSILMYIKFGMIGIIISGSFAELVRHFIDLNLIIKKINTNYKKLIFYNLIYMFIFLIIINMGNYLIILSLSFIVVIYSIYKFKKI